jgi:hypothetical protein
MDLILGQQPDVADAQLVLAVCLAEAIDHRLV